MNETKLGITSAEPQGFSVDSSARERGIKTALEYWRARLAGAPPALELPTDRPRPPVQQFQPAKIISSLSAELTKAIETVSNDAGVRVSEVLLAAFEVLLLRYTGQQDFLLGCYFPDTESAFIVRGDCSGAPSFRMFLSRMDDFLQDARAHMIPIDRLSDHIDCETDPSRNPLFQVFFSYDEATEHATDGRVSLWPLDIHLHTLRRPDGLAVEFIYDATLFENSTISRMADQFKVLIGGVVANTTTPITLLPILTETESRQLLLDWNRTQAEYPRDRCIHHLLEEQARRTPDAVAVVFEDHNLTYGELNRRSNQLANHLLTLGVGPDALIGLCVERGFDMVVGLLAILKAGAAYVPLDPGFPPDRLAFMLEDAEVAALLTQRHLVPTLPSIQGQLVCLDAEWATIAKQSEQNPTINISSERLAYTIYTSGSTGKPKGVQVLHRGVVNFLTSMRHRPGMDCRDRILSVTTLCFDIAGLEIYLPLTVGASVEIVSREVAADGTELLRKLNQGQATVMQATPATWRMLIDAGWEGTPGLKILCGGEALSHRLANQLLDRCGSLWNMYGPTETTIWSTLAKVERDHNAVVIGHPIANTQVYILDELLQPVPIGVAGELHIGGDGVARGYLKRPELTASKFIQDPFSADAAARLYKTGDLARYRSTGEIEFLGRLDHQVKIRGFRIELGEIETVLRQYPAISDAVVIDREDMPGDKRLVAYLITEHNAEPVAGDLRHFLKERLPDYMVPSAFVRLATMPLTPNGKVNRRALPAPDNRQLTPKSTSIRPSDEIEAGLARIWEEVLGVTQIGVQDNFFELGGHSLLAVRMMHRAAQRFNKKLPAATLFQAPTIEQLARIFRQSDWTPHWTSLVPIQPGDGRNPFFCVHGAGGVIIRFRELAQYLGPEQTMYGFQAQGLDESLPCHSRVEDMAAHYIAEMRSIQPHGPYFIGGYSFGGLIALEMAHQLQTLQEEAALVVLFDTFCTPALLPHGKNRGTKQNIGSVLWKLVRSATNEPLIKSVKLISKGIRRRWDHMTVPHRLKLVRRACERAAREYVPRPYDGQVLLFRSSHPPVTVSDPYEGWRSYLKNGLDTYEVAGDHDNIMLEPQVRIVAEHLKLHLQALPSATQAAD